MIDVIAPPNEYSQSFLEESQEDDNEFDKGIEKLRGHNWNEELEEMSYPGNKEVIVKLLDEFARGVIDVLERLKLQKKIPKDFIFPDICLEYDLREKYTFKLFNTFDESGTGRVITNALAVSLFHLHNLTHSPTLSAAVGNMLEFETKDVNGLLVYAAGVEEGAHAVFLRMSLLLAH